MANPLPTMYTSAGDIERDSTEMLGYCSMKEKQLEAVDQALLFPTKFKFVMSLHRLKKN